MGKMETLYAEISDVLDYMEEKNRSFGCEMSGAGGLQDHIVVLKDQLKKERNDYIVSIKLSIRSNIVTDQIVTWEAQVHILVIVLCCCYCYFFSNALWKLNLVSLFVNRVFCNLLLWRLLTPDKWL